MKTESIHRHPPARRLYGKSLIRSNTSEIMKRLLVFSLLAFPVIAGGVNMTCLRHSWRASDPRWNDIARYLAGMEISETSPLRVDTADPRYREHARFMDGLWNRIQGETIDRMQMWRRDTLPGVQVTTAFYPLSGADFINLYTLFPHASRYLMIALEPPGNTGLLLDRGSNRMIEGLTQLRRGIYLYGVNNYFQSKVMYREMNNTLLPGAAPVLLIFMARLGLTVTKVENITILGSGAVVPRTAVDPEKEGDARSRGIRIRFSRKGSSRSGELIYLSMRLEADSAGNATPEGRLLDRLKGTATLLKSAVYLLQEERYRPLRDFILARSRLIVQDDSGIAYGAFDGKWDVALYGTYRPTLSLKGCRVNYQHDLKDAYIKNSHPLPFKFGYGILIGPDQSNLMIAKKKT